MSSESDEGVKRVGEFAKEEFELSALELTSLKTWLQSSEEAASRLKSSSSSSSSKSISCMMMAFPTGMAGLTPFGVVASSNSTDPDSESKSRSLGSSTTFGVNERVTVGVLVRFISSGAVD